MSAPDFDRVKKSFFLLARAAFSRVDFFALYASTVRAQNGDGTLEVSPDDSKVPSVSAVPIRLGLPGVKVKVSPGARVLLGFENGDPKRPIATLWESSGLIELNLGAGVAAHPVAYGDTLNTAINVLATSIGTAVSGIPTGGAAAGTAITTAVTAFNVSAALALSPLVKVS